MLYLKLVNAKKIKLYFLTEPTHISPLAMVSGDFDGDLDERVSVAFDGENYILRLVPELAEKLVGEFLS